MCSVTSRLRTAFLIHASILLMLGCGEETVPVAESSKRDEKTGEDKERKSEVVSSKEPDEHSDSRELIAEPSASSAPTAEVTPMRSIAQWSITADSGDFAYPAKLEFLGWSADGRYYATRMETDDYSPSGCSGMVDIQIVDTTRDSWPKGGHVMIANDINASGSACTHASMDAVRAAAKKKLSGLLSRYQIVESNLYAPLPMKVSGQGFKLTLPDGRDSVLSFWLTGNTAMTDDAKAGYRLAFTSPVPQVIEAGTRHRSSYYSYKLKAVMPSPSGQSAAFVIERIEWGFEGSLTYSFMTNGVGLPWNM